MVPSQRDHECGLAPRRDAGAVVVSADGLHQVWIDRGGGAAGLVAAHPLKAPSAGIEAVIDGAGTALVVDAHANPAAGGGGVCGRCCHGRSLRSVPPAGRVIHRAWIGSVPIIPERSWEDGPRPYSGPVPGGASKPQGGASRIAGVNRPRRPSRARTGLRPAASPDAALRRTRPRARGERRR